MMVGDTENHHRRTVLAEIEATGRATLSAKQHPSLSKKASTPQCGEILGARRGAEHDAAS